MKEGDNELEVTVASNLYTVYSCHTLQRASYNKSIINNKLQKYILQYYTVKDENIKK
jgi:hypothetical protein